MSTFRFRLMRQRWMSNRAEVVNEFETRDDAEDARTFRVWDENGYMDAYWVEEVPDKPETT